MPLTPDEARRLADELLDVASDMAGATSSLGVGARVGAYTIESLVGVGGMGAVYRARRERSAQVVALKVVRPELLSSSSVRRFGREAELLSRLRHPGIARLFEADAARTPLGEQPYFAMELVDGEPLPEYAESAGLSTRERLALFVKVCDAVEHAHREGVIHRDLKPGNVLVTPAGETKILDFGVARTTDADFGSSPMRFDGAQLAGTLPYMSPEQVAGNASDVDTRSDVYALGVLLYQLLSGRLPYEIGRGTIPDAVRAIRERDPMPLGGIDTALRGDIESIVAKALDKDRDRRYQSASDLADDIRRHLDRGLIGARSAGAWGWLSRIVRRRSALRPGLK